MQYKRFLILLARHHKFQGLGGFALVVSDAKADNKSVSMRGLTEPKLEMASEPGLGPAALEGC